MSKYILLPQIKSVGAHIGNILYYFDNIHLLLDLYVAYHR